MCVIISGRETRPDMETLRQCADANGHGAGIAWIDPTSGKVHYRKGLSKPGQVARILRKHVPQGAHYAIHFRIATAGHKVPALTHPFPVEAEPSLSLHGEADAVLFHNGSIQDWKAALFDTSGGFVPDESVWSDSRAMAMNVAAHGPSVMDKTPGKFLLLGKAEADKEPGVTLSPTEDAAWGWTKKDGMLFSNMHWEPKRYVGFGTGSPVYEGYNPHRAFSGYGGWEDWKERGFSSYGEWLAYDHYVARMIQKHGTLRDYFRKRWLEAPLEDRQRWTKEDRARRRAGATGFFD